MMLHPSTTSQSPTTQQLMATLLHSWLLPPPLTATPFSSTTTRLSLTQLQSVHFSVTTDGSANAVTAVAVSGSTVELNLTDTVKNEQTVTVAYSDPTEANDNNAIQDSAGNDAATLSSTAVTNNSSVAGTAPTFVSAAISTDGTKLLLTYSETLFSTTAGPSAFSVTTDGNANAVVAVAVSGSTVELTLTDSVKNDQTVTVAYSDPSGANDNNAIQDSHGNDAATLSSTQSPTTHLLLVPHQRLSPLPYPLTAPRFSSPTAKPSLTQLQAPPPSPSQQTAVPMLSQALPSPDAPLHSTSPTPSKTVRPSPLPTAIRPEPTTTTPSKTKLAMTRQH